MFKLNAKLMVGPVLAAALLAGCGGSSSDGGTLGGQGAGAMERTITAVAEFVNGLIANNPENSEPIDVNSLTLAVDDTAEPVAVQ